MTNKDNLYKFGNKLYNNKNNSYIEFENINYKTSNLTNGYFQGYKVRLYKQIKDKTFKQVLSVFEVPTDLWTKFKTMFINDLIKLETKYYFIDDSIVRGN